MIDEVKVDGLDELVDSIKDAIDNSGVDTTGATAGQVLTAIEDMGGNIIPGWTTPDTGIPTIGVGDNGKKLQAVVPAEGDPYAAWVSEQGASYTYDNSVHTQIGQYNEHSGDTVSVYPIKTAVCSPMTTIYLGNGQGAFEANIGQNAEILSCTLIAKDTYTLYSIPCMVTHAETLPLNTTYTAQWSGSGLPSNGGSAKFYVTYVEKDNL